MDIKMSERPSSCNNRMELRPKQPTIRASILYTSKIVPAAELGPGTEYVTLSYVWGVPTVNETRMIVYH
jgi:hypothetical protein